MWESAYHQQGFVHLPGLFAPSELVPVRQQLERWVDSVATALQPDRADEHPHGLFPEEPFERRLAMLAAHAEAAEGSGNGSRVGSDLLKQMQRGGSVVQPVWSSCAEEPCKAVFDIVTDSRLLKVVSTLLRGQELSFHRGQCRPKLPGTHQNAAFPMHQDSQYFVRPTL